MMNEKKRLTFRKLEPHLSEELHKCYESSSVEYLRIEPKGYLIAADYIPDAENILNMPLKPDDIFVVSFPRSGTTWTQELVWMVANDLDFERASAIPLTARYNFIEFSMFFPDSVRSSIKEQAKDNPEIIKAVDQLGVPGTVVAASMPSPRFFKTHLPLSLLPPTLLDQTKVVYVARDPRDVAVSFYHQNKLFKIVNFIADFKKYWHFFKNDLLLWTPFFENVKEAWEARNHPNMLFLFYEELSKDLPAIICRVADFLGKQLTEEQVNSLTSHLSFDNFKNNKSVNYDEFRQLGLLNSDQQFIRKGKTGGWREYFDEEMCQEAETWIADNLRDTDLRFPNMSRD